MRKKLKFGTLKIIGIVLGALIILALIGGIVSIRAPWADYNATLQVKGLKGKVVVKRDKWAVPHIYAENEEDLFIAQGYVHAQDRLWQMELHRRLCAGTMSEIAGPGGLNMDKIVRVFGVYQIARDSLPMIEPEVMKFVEAYCQGVNAYVEANWNKLPVEYKILNFKPAPWTPLDIISWGNFMAVSTGQNWRYEIFRAQVAAKLSPEDADKLLPPSEEGHPLIIPKETEELVLGDGLLSGKIFDDLLPGSQSLGWASGAWVVNGSHTVSGKPVIASDAHMDLVMPSMWIENGLHGGRFDITGFSFPGFPFVVLGHNKDISWAFTNMNPDVQDLYIEKLDNDENPSKYLYKGEWKNLESREEVIKVKGKKPVVLNLLFTHHGPLMRDIIKISDKDLSDLKKYDPEKGYQTPYRRERWSGPEQISFSWALHEGSVVSNAVYRMNLAQNWDDFRNALRSWDSLSQNFVYADTKGNIGYQAAGKIPIRVKAHQGAVPVPGWSGDYDWQGYVPFDELPTFYNPPSGYIVTANNKMVTEDYPYNLTYDWFHPGYRAKRINTLLKEKLDSKKLLDVEDMHDIQKDSYSFASEEIVPFLVAVDTNNKVEKEALEYVKDWNFNYDIDSQGAGIYLAWYTYMRMNTFDDELEKNEVWGPFLPMKQILALIDLMDEPDNNWFDNVFTPGRETRDDIILKSLKDAVAWLSKEYGANPSGWTLGRIQTVTVQHMVFGEVPVLKDIFNSKKFPFSGSPVSISFAFSFTYPPGKFNVRYASTQRQIIDLADWDSMLSINSTGQNGNLYHPNRLDQMPLWAEENYRYSPFTEEGVDKNMVTRSVLKGTGQ